ncbi:MAG: multi-sensor signal transduction histidine kinase [Sedimentibacter sp.]|nr:multi-sensor signal transduction histidine kinase [Sedimentibacter sp.]
MFDKKIIRVMLLLVACAFVFLADQFTSNTYDLNLFEYLKYSSEITDQEREYLQKKKVIYHASDKNAPPFTFKDDKNGQYKGLVIDYLSALSIELEVEMEFVPMVWEEALSSVISGETDMTELIPSPERSTLDVLESIKLLINGEVDAIVGDEPVVVYFTGQLGIEDEVEILNPPLYERDICLGVQKSDSQLLTILNKGILNLKQKDFVQKIQQKWLGLSEPILNDRMSANVTLFFMTIIVVFAIFFIIVLIWSYTLTSEVKKRTIELLRSRNDLQMTFDAMSDFIAVVSEEGTIENVNNSYCLWLKKDRDEIIGSNIRMFPILDKASLNVRDKLIIETNFNGRHYVLYITPLKYDDNRDLIVIEDDTDKILTQQQMLQQNKMIAVGQLAAGVAHEIRNPLGLIRNYSYVLKGKLPGQNKDPLIDKSINIIESSVLRAGKMVDNLLNFSRINDDEFKNINLFESLNEIIAFECKRISEKNIDVKVNCDENLMFLTNLETLTHIVLNLLSNAIDALSSGGNITIDCSADRKYLYMNVTDTGEGIQEADIEHIFNPFFTTKSAGKGTGLGLYIVYNEIQKINGDISVESQVGIGTTFKLKFSLKED